MMQIVSLKLVCRRYKNHRRCVAIPPSLDSNATHVSVSALAFLKANEASDLGHTFNRHEEEFKINTFVDHDEDTGRVSFKLVNNRKNVLFLSASRGKDGKCAAYRIGLHSKGEDDICKGSRRRALLRD